MTIIKESHTSILARNTMEQEKRRIMKMDFKKRSDKTEWSNLNKFLLDKQSLAQSSDFVNDSVAGIGIRDFSPGQ